MKDRTFDSGEHTRPACGGRRPADRIEPFRGTGSLFHVPGGTPGTNTRDACAPRKTLRPGAPQSP